MLKKRQRKIKTTPDNVLNAPDVIDDFCKPVNSATLMTEACGKPACY